MATGWQGEEEFARLFEEYRHLVLRLASRLVGPVDAPDVVQEVMLRAWRARPEISEERQVGPWLRTVTRNVCVDVLRRRREVPAPDVMLEELSPLVGDEPEAAGMRADLRRQLRVALGRLSARDAEVLVLHDMNGASAAEIAVLHGSNANAVRQRLFRARKALVRHYRAVGGALPALLPSCMHLRRLFHRLRPSRTSHALPVATGMALALALVATDHRPMCREILADLVADAYQPPRRSWVPGPSDRDRRPRPSPQDSALVYDAARKEHLLVSRLRDEGSVLEIQTWVWSRDAPGWIDLAPAHFLPRLSSPSLVYDSRRRKVVLLGFSEEDFQIWNWDGRDWTWQSAIPATEFPRRTSYSATYDPQNDHVIVFGGRRSSDIDVEGLPSSVNNRIMGDLYLWTPASRTWRQASVSPGASPGSRYGASMAFDVNSKKVVMFGGVIDTSSVRLQDMWTWDGKDWVEIPKSGAWPARRSGAPMVATRTGLILYGGGDQANTFVDTWRWDGAWADLGEVGPKGGGDQLRMDYDLDRDVLMLFGNMPGTEDSGIRSVYSFRPLVDRPASKLKKETSSGQEVPTKIPPTVIGDKAHGTRTPPQSAPPLVEGRWVDCI